MHGMQKYTPDTEMYAGVFYLWFYGKAIFGIDYLRFFKFNA